LEGVRKEEQIKASRDLGRVKTLVQAVMQRKSLSPQRRN